jgi:integrase
LAVDRAAELVHGHGPPPPGSAGEPVGGGVRPTDRADLRDLFARIGYPGITSHTFRKTVGSLMDDAGLSARAAADQLGHAKASMTQDRYFGRRVRATGGAAVLEAVDRTSPSERHG